MSRMTNAELADLISAVDDGVVKLEGKVLHLDKARVERAKETDKKIDDILITLKEANGRQRKDHDRVGVLEATVEAVKTNQEKCPVLRGKWNMNDPKVFVGTTLGMIASVVGLMAVVERFIT